MVLFMQPQWVLPCIVVDICYSKKYGGGTCLNLLIILVQFKLKLSCGVLRVSTKCVIFPPSYFCVPLGMPWVLDETAHLNCIALGRIDTAN